MRTAVALLISLTLGWSTAASVAADYDLFGRTNLVAWCIVPFDAKKRGPEERAQMLEQLGLHRFAYDWRAEHIPTFDAEIEALQKHHIEITAWWFPTAMGKDAQTILDVLARHKIKTQLWVMGGGTPVKDEAEQKARVEAEAKRIRPIAEAAAKIGCTVALYNHGNWFGEPENQLAIIERLNLPNVGIVYNFHHGHGDIARFPELFAKMKPHLLAVCLNGMVENGEKIGKMILPIGQGDRELAMVKVVRDSGWHGPIGILNHTDEDAEARLKDNLAGLDWLVPQLDGKAPGPKPVPVSWHASAPKPTVSAGGMVVEGKAEYRKFPITVECRAKMNAAQGFNILVASDTKASAEHWELYSFAGSGVFSVYLPGRGGAIQSAARITDGQWHDLAAILETNRVRLYVDGKLVKEQPIQPFAGNPINGGLAIGQLVEGTIGCDGVISAVRLSRGVREISGGTETLKADAQTLGFWKPAEPKTETAANAGIYWQVEDAAARAKLPEYKTIPAAKPNELTPANGFPKPETFLNWQRSLGDAGSRRYSGLTQINRDNVKQLQVAWTYHSADGTGNIQCNPIVVDGVMYAPTVGRFIVAVNAETGLEIWRFKPELPKRLGLEDAPARRGLVYWPGENGHEARIFFACGKWVYAVTPKEGKPVAEFGENGRVPLPMGGTAVGAIFKNVFVIPGFDRDVFGYDVYTGKLLWQFHTIPQPGEPGYETWDRTDEGANCWGGMALDDVRGIAYIGTGSPKPNFLGMRHRGDNLFGNCLLAIDVMTGKRLWHFQEIPHDIWDLDVPAPPNLVTIMRDGRKIDAVACVTKIGNTLLLDRVTGKPIFPFRFRRAPTSTIPGEQTAPYQPAVELPEPFTRLTFTADDLTPRSEEAHDFVKDKSKSLQYGFFPPMSDRKVTVYYGIHGGAEWTGSCVDAENGHLYVSASEIPWLMSLIVNDEPPYNPKATPTPGEKIFLQNCAQCHGPDRMGVGVAPPLRGLRHRMKDEEVIALWKTGRGAMPIPPPMTEQEQKALLDYLFLRDRSTTMPAAKPERPSFVQNSWLRFLDQDGYPGNKPPWGTLNCLDLNTGKLLWKVPLGEYDELTKQGVPKTGTENFGGAIVTAGGLVFCGGTRDIKFRAFDKTTGAELWSAALPWGGFAPPMTYEVKGRQYVVIPATGGGKLGGPMGDAYVAFALPKK